jgi:hypothetical protein
MPWVIVSAASIGFASSSLQMPKSSSRGVPFSSTRMLPGFKSRWTTKRLCA